MPLLLTFANPIFHNCHSDRCLSHLNAPSDSACISETSITVQHSLLDKFLDLDEQATLDIRVMHDGEPDRRATTDKARDFVP